MRKHPRVPLLLVAVLITGVLTVVVATLRPQQGSPQADEHRAAKQKLKEHLDKFPAADFEAAESPDPEKRARRRAKNKVYNDPNGNKFDASNPVIGASSNDWEWGLESTLPVGQSSAVVVGKVTDAQAFVSEDKANVYSEYAVQVESVIKNFDGDQLRAGDTVVAERQGGRVRLPGGGVSGLFISGQNAPQVGRRYVLFLGYNKNDSNGLGAAGQAELSRHVLTGYELRGGKVFPLDNPGGLSFAEHAGKDEAAFISEVRRLLAAAPQVSPE